MFPDTLPADAQNALAILGQGGVLSSTYMAGGTSLALQMGHRQSVDFDFFTDVEFDTGEIVSKLNSIGTFTVDQLAPRTLLGEFMGTKFSLFYLSYPLIDKTVDYKGINLASTKDIAAMKLAAITGRGTKKDYIDLYFLAKEKYQFSEMFAFYDQKYGVFEENKMTILKSLQYFVDVDESKMPIMFKSVDWEEIKKYLQGQAVKLWL